MTGLLLAALLNVSPGIALTDTMEARHAFLYVAQDERVPRPMFEPLSREQLVAELARIDGVRPGLGGPIALLAVGLALAVPGGGVTAAGLIGLLASSRLMSMGLGTLISAVLTGVGVVMVTVGVILAIVGGVTLGVRIKARSTNGKEADEIRRRMEALEAGQPLPPPPQQPQGPQTNFVTPGPLQTLLTF